MARARWLTTEATDSHENLPRLLASHEGAGGGFVKLTGLLTPLLSLEDEALRTDADTVLARLETLPHKGQVPIPWTLDSAAGSTDSGPRIKLRTQLPPPAVVDLVALLVTTYGD